MIVTCPSCGGRKNKKDILCGRCTGAFSYWREELQAKATHKDLERDLAWQNHHARANARRAYMLEKAAQRQRDLELREKTKLEHAATREIADRALMRASLLRYVERRVPNYKTSFAHEHVCNKIEQFVRDVADGKSPRMILQLPSRFGKSQLASEAAPAWILGWHPDWDIILSSATLKLPTRFSKGVRAQIEDPRYQEIFPDGARVDKNDSGAEEWRTEQGGGVKAIGVGGQLIGFGANILIVDDPVKGDEEAESPKALEDIYEWFSSTAYSRLAPGGGILVIMQRWSEEDLVGRLIANMEAEQEEIRSLRATVAELNAKERPTQDELDAIEQYTHEADELEASMDRWEVLSYPALATHDEYLVGPDIVRVSSNEEPPVNGELLRKKDEAIHPERYTRYYYLKLKRANPKRFAGMYQQEPVIDEGDYFSRADFKRYHLRDRPMYEHMHMHCAWDLAIGTRDSNDHTVGLAGGLDHLGRLWLTDRIRGRFGDLEKVADMVIDMHVRNQALMTGVERTHLEMALAPILARRMRERREFITMAEGKDALKPIADKRVRAREFQALAKAGLVYVPYGDEWDEYISWLVKFGSTRVDDDVDASAWLGKMVGKSGTPADPTFVPQQEFKGWYQKLMEEMGYNTALADPTDGDFMSS